MTAVPAERTAQRHVTSGDARIAVYEQGNPHGPTVVLVHGWPDSHVLWDSVVPLLSDRFRVITYDNRGAGHSTVPQSHHAYALGHLADDFAAVIDDVSPDRPVHVIAHDWGSATVWEYVTRAEASARVASYTSVSGMDAGSASNFLRESLKRPYRPKTFVAALSQLRAFSYMSLFSVPVLAPGFMRLFGAELIRKRFVGRGVPSDLMRHSDTFVADAANGMKIYRANFFPSLFGGARTGREVEVPVQLVVNTLDPYVRAQSFDHIEGVAQLYRRDIRARHWSPFTHPQVLAAAVADMVELTEGGKPSRALRRGQVGRARKPFEDTLVSVTGAGSGIGRATALEFARLGAELVVSDIDEATVRQTAVQIAEQGGIAHAYTLDVSDAAGVEAFADEVCADHGVPDIVVNNAGIGAAGSFLNTPPELFDRVLDINLGGVVNCCRAFARRLVERGTGGTIVNVASMASYAPLQSLNAYCTSKAAVFMFSDCLRAELDEADVFLTTICPGVVNTNIVATTHMQAGAGKDDAVDGRRAQLEKMFALRRYGPDKVAKAIVSAVQKRKPIRPVTPEAYLLYGTSKMLPQALRSTARGKVL